MRKILLLLSILLFLFILLPNSAFSLPEEAEYDISYSFLGSYKKTLRFSEELKEYTGKYEKEYNVEGLYFLAFVVAMYESGGNDTLTSWAGAKGLMQVMPKTKRYMDVDDPKEAGVKYLAYLARIFKKHSGPLWKSRVIQAYNGGPGRVKKGFVKFETLQYLQGVSLYYNLVLRKLGKIERLMQKLEIKILDKPMTWIELSEELGISVLDLRLYNPFFAGFYSRKPIPKGEVFVYPKDNMKLVLETTNDASGSRRFFYVVKEGDILHHLANAFGFSYYEMRNRGGLLLWGSLQLGTRIEVTDSPYIKIEN